ncbi:MAG TPA: Appr-1-p processing protein [bacterium]|nr:Appr-1-p processing protein [bacterium]
MITVRMGNIFESKKQTLTNTVNCVGVMGKGIALEFKNKFPDMFKDYEKRCKAGDVKPGRPYLYKTLIGHWILNFPTKDHWRSLANLNSIIQGLEYLKNNYKPWGITSIALPPLGCGNGQLEWRVVGPTIYRHIKNLDIDVELYAPYNTPHEEMQESFLDVPGGSMREMPEPEFLKPGLIALVEILDRIEKQPFHFPVGRTIFQKIAYIATEQGIDTGLVYAKSSFGPYSAGLKEAQTKLLNHGLLTEERRGSFFIIRVGGTFKDAKKSYGSQLAAWDKIIDKVVDLFVRVTTHQAEIAATVIFAAKLAASSKNEISEMDVLREVREWKERRRPKLEDAELANAIRNLNALGWLQAKPSDELPLPVDELAGV